MFDAFRKAFLYFFDRGEEIANRGSKRELECDSEEEVVSPKYQKVVTTRYRHIPLTSLDFLVPPETRMKKASKSLQNELSFLRGRTSESTLRQASKENVSVLDDECIILSDEENDWIPASPVLQSSARLKLKQKTVQPNPFEVKTAVAVEPEKDKDIEVLKTVKSKEECSFHFSTPREGISPIHKRFFPSVRREITINMRNPNSTKVKEPQPVNSKPKKRSALDESIRLDEKLQYSQLLKQQCSTFPFIFGKDAESFPRKQVVLRTRNEKSPKTKMVVDVIDLTDEAIESANETASSKKASEKEGDDELEIIEEKTSPEKENYSILFNPFKNQVFCTNWLPSESELFDFAARKRERRLEEQRIKAELCRKQNKKIYTDILEERIRNHMKITEAILEDEVIIEDDDELVLPKLTPEIEKRVSFALRLEPQSEVLVEAFSLRLTRRDIYTLAGTNWLNDEVINFYMNLLIERGKKDKYPKVYAFNTFFYPRLHSSGYSAVKRWTRKIDLFVNEIIVIPVHLGVHWCLAAINFKNKTICYYDSMGGNNDACLQTLWSYLSSECADKKQQKFNFEGWRTENVKKIPQQMNGSDCGVFSCTYAEFLCRRSKFGFSQKDMPYFRRKMVHEILSKELMM